VREIIKLEDMGITAVWLRSIGAGGDPITIFGSAAIKTKRILMGTAITQIWGQHPVMLANQAQALSLLSQGRFRLGLGTSAWRLMDRIYGVSFNPPLGHLKEYVQILKGILQNGSIAYDGKYFTARTEEPLDPFPPKVPIMVSALRVKSFALA
jgi:alkanesulfonate monooxygenase SsuD/methylene tetrahydromethanopterin reductase-like flavin-dependent oxidoreductase (luciferase family)